MRDINEIIHLQGIIVTGDDTVFQRLASVAFSIGLKLHRLSARDAMHQLEQHKTHAVIIDCRVKGTQELIARLRMHGSNRHCVVFALADSPELTREAYTMGANFVLDLPLRTDAANRCFRAARGLMIAEYRRYMRVPSDGVATVALNTGETIAVRVSNLSVGGMAIVCEDTKALPASFNIRFTLGEHKRLDLIAQSVWKNGRGEYGLQFTKTTASEREALAAWVDAHQPREKNIPLAAVMTR